jgi:hypothetical protein
MGKANEQDALGTFLKELDEREHYREKLQHLADTWRRGGAGIFDGRLAGVAVRLKREAVAAIRAKAKTKETPRERADYLERELMELNQLDDYVPPGTYGGVVWNVKDKVQGLLTYWRGQQKEEAAAEPEQAGPIISGTRAPEYAFKARDVIKEKPHISAFGDMEAAMEPRGGSKVQSIKRGIGYEDLPDEEKDFHRFKTMLFEKVERMEKRFA